MRQKHGTKALLALVLSVALLNAGAGGTTFASDGDDYNDEYGDEYYDEEYDEEYDEDNGEDGYDPENDEPGDSGASPGVATSALLDGLYAERDQLEGSIEALKSEAQAIQASIANAKNEKERAVAERNGLAAEIAIKSELIGKMEESLRLLGEEVGLRQLEIEEKQAEYDANYILLQKRLGAMYMQDDGTVLGLLIGSGSFSELLTRSEYMVLVAEHDRNLLRELNDQRVAIEEEKAALEDAIALQEEEKAGVEEEKAALDAMHTKASQEVQSHDALEREFMADLAANKAREEAARAELDKVFQEIEWSKNPYSGGVMTWPLPGFSTISSTYGPRFGGNDLHTGMDITGSGGGSVSGATIVAAADGVVNKVNLSYAPGEGYGIYLIIDHGVNENGQSVSTLYAHCSAITASLGQQVKRGDPIALVGSTGWSTGPHLHFEVRVGGDDVEPSQYLAG